jgi:divalent metal cation (Fe/Co/Zn/Cd) transporter
MTDQATRAILGIALLLGVVGLAWGGAALLGVLTALIITLLVIERLLERSTK